MTPYYDEDGITIYHGDCREILPTLQGHALVTDPPYGINWTRGTWADDPAAYPALMHATVHDSVVERIRRTAPSPGLFA